VRISTRGRGFHELTGASRCVTENADPDVRADLESFAQRLALGTWQGVFLWEHRHDPMQRELVVTLNGEPEVS
jgi:thiamine phosphate synthase YjbQ (UPF0047 family)